jgi:hypothetical protein
MARFAVGVVFGVVVGTVFGAAAGLHAAEADGGPDEVEQMVAPPEPAPVPVATIWDRLAQCESTGHWAANTGNGYYGGLQMDLPFWRRHGGLQYASRPDLAARAAQIAVAQIGLRVQGPGAWPVCGRRVGLG